MDIGIIISIGAIAVATIFAVILFYVSESRTKKFQETLQRSIKKQDSKLEYIIDGIPKIKNIDKQKDIIFALSEYNNQNYSSAIGGFEKLLNQYRWSDSERSAILNFISVK